VWELAENEKDRIEGMYANAQRHLDESELPDAHDSLSQTTDQSQTRPDLTTWVVSGAPDESDVLKSRFMVVLSLTEQ
jgi:hypothetical protein